MLRALVPLRRILHQPILALICALTSTISIVMTLRFCWHVFPDERQVCAAVGLACELAKLRFMAIGCADLQAGSRQRMRGLGLVTLTLILSAVSVAASTGYLMQTQARSTATPSPIRAPTTTR